MGIPGWSRTPARNTAIDPQVASQDGASARSFPVSLRALMAAARRLADDQGGALVTAGRLNAYEVTTGSGLAELRPGLALIVRADRDNTAEATLNVDGLGPLPWVDAGGVRLKEGRILDGRFYSVILDADAEAWRVQAGASTLDEIPGLIDLRAEVDANAEQVAEDAVQTAADRQAVALAAIQTAADRAEVATNRAAVAADKTATTSSANAAAADRATAAAARTAAEAARDQAQTAAVSGRVSRPTKAELDAVAGSYPLGAVGVVERGAGMGEYVRRGTGWAFTGPTTAGLAAARDRDAQRAAALRTGASGGAIAAWFTDKAGKVLLGFDLVREEVIGAVLNIDRTRRALAAQVPGLRVARGTIAPWITDAGGKILLGFDRTREQVVGAILGIDGVYRALAARFLDFRSGRIGTIVAWFVDRDGKVLFGYDRQADALIGAWPASFGSGSGSASSAGLTYLPADPLAPSDYAGSVSIRALITYGQSLSLGAQSIPPISTSQPYANITFQAGPRSTKAGSVGNNPGLNAFAPLVENTLTGEGGSSRGESPCSGLGNGFTQLAAVTAGTAPASSVILSAAAGHGGYALSQLVKGSAWYQLLIDQVTAGRDLAQAQGKTYEVTAVPFSQGETDAGTGVSRSAYAAALAQLQQDIQADIRAITGQTSPVWLILSQQGRYTASAGGQAISLAQLDACAQNPRIVLSTPIYHLPRASDALHLTNVGSLWMGAYWAKTASILVTERRRPKWIRPLVATSIGAKIRITFEAPVAPLVLDTTRLAATAAQGFAATDGTGALTILGVAVADGRHVDLTCHRTISGTPTVRYALDALGAGLNIEGGASGNLRDSDPASVTLSGQVLPLFNVCPAFSLAGINLG